VATNALELGVDIGVLDAVILCGFPVTLASFVGGPNAVLRRALTSPQRQQIGRAGRRARDSLAVYVADTSGTDTHLAHPDDLFDKPTPDLVINLESPLVIEAHLQCAAFEMPLSSDDACWFGPLTTTLCETKLVRDKEGWWVKLITALGRVKTTLRFHTHPKHLPYPAGGLSIRGADEEKYTVIDVSGTGAGVKGRILEETEISRALFELYEGAIVS
jgi:DEAD/DEAH box helicase domain-containing protein